MKDWITPGLSHKFSPTIELIRTEVHKKYPNSSIDSSVYNYELRKNDQSIFTVKYDVIFPTWSEYYPYTYSEETWITYNHHWYASFITVNGNLDEYRDLRYQMMKSIVTEGLQERVWW
jgi:hypothetical protein